MGKEEPVLAAIRHEPRYYHRGHREHGGGELWRGRSLCRQSIRHEPVSPDDASAASRRISGRVVRTPLVRLNADLGPAEVFLKLENLQPVGSFKLRGRHERGAPDPPGRSLQTGCGR